jgi:hypothetical protein
MPTQFEIEPTKFAGGWLRPCVGNQLFLLALFWLFGTRLEA